ncbi:MAG: hypothetical protein RBU25_09700 [Lentisphaeria bacterium]|jgi:hypothetical protein|nr:hypothetical protein [Lentisphaeria bacterium]
MANENAALVEVGNPAAEPAELALADDSFAELQKVSNYRLVRKTLRGAGIGSIIFGLIAMFIGFGGMAENPINALLGVIGLFLLVEGIWLVVAPTPAGMIVDGIALIILGVWNIFITLANAAGGEGGGGFAVMGVFQIIWGCQGFGRYARFSSMPVEKPSPETVKMIDDIVKEILKMKGKTDQDLVEFQMEGKAWKGRLSEDMAVFVEVLTQDVAFARKDAVRILPQGKALIGKTIKATIKFRDKAQNGTISPENFARYEAWKGAEVSVAAAV